ncbi:hypothetical protein SSBG_00298 [Streptomyces sp. SPB074]|nr:hypothetical protein SSBG_00298 [Streptomyces sp. SPB074]
MRRVPGTLTGDRTQGSPQYSIRATRGGATLRRTSPRAGDVREVPRVLRRVSRALARAPGWERPPPGGALHKIHGTGTNRFAR